MQSENDTQHMYASDTDTDARASITLSSRSPDYSAPASSRPRDTDGVSSSRVSQSLDFSVENLMAWKGQSETETRLYKTVLISLRKGLFSVATIWRRSEIMLAVWKTEQYNECTEKHQ